MELNLFAAAVVFLQKNAYAYFVHLRGDKSLANKEKHRKINRISIKIVTAIYFVVAIIVMTLVISIVGYNFHENSVMDQYQDYVNTVLNYAYTASTDYSFADMITAGNMPEEYEQLRSELNQIKENSDIDYLYAIYFDDINDINSLTYAINSKTAKDLDNGETFTYMGTPCEEGSFEEDTLQTLYNAVQTKKTEPGFLYGYSEGYGYMYNGYKVLFDSKGDPAGLICVEINTNSIKEELNLYIRNIVIFVTIFTVVITVVFVGGAEHHFSYPIARLTDSVKDFIGNIGNQEALDESVRRLKSIEIHSENEIGELYSTVSRLESDMTDQYRKIRKYSEDVIKMQDGLIAMMANMVENRDSSTGDHIKRTASYVRIILEGLKKKGYYADLLTPQYIDNVVRSAPLHDTGKIGIPDNILNKPGKLTPDEFEIMKTHAELGREIIEKAMKTITIDGESYLSEAANMAAYHQERWDGTGYPEGLKEEEIPLSARVMAVADVYDALTSERVYKTAYTEESALEIIHEGSGTQFDPKCVEVFLEAASEIGTVLEKYREE